MGAAKGSLANAVGSMYVQKYFKEDAKQSALEMVADIRNEFYTILSEVKINVYEYSTTFKNIDVIYVMLSRDLRVVSMAWLTFFSRSTGWTTALKPELRTKPKEWSNTLGKWISSICLRTKNNHLL